MAKAKASGWTYVVIWGLLAILTTATWLVSRAELGSWSLPVAMAIAITKAALIVLFFMHLRHHPAAGAVAGLVSVIFLGLLISLILGDALLRFEPARPPGPFIHELDLQGPAFEAGSDPTDQGPASPKSR